MPWRGITPPLRPLPMHVDDRNETNLHLCQQRELTLEVLKPFEMKHHF